MTLPSYLLVSFACLAAVALVLLGQAVEPLRQRNAASITMPTALPAEIAIPDPVMTALEDLAAWPSAAGR